MAETKKKGRLFDLPETKGSFQLKGIVSGTEKDGFYKEIKTKSNKDMRMVNFGVGYAEGSTLYVNLQGMEQENVYFSKKAKNKGDNPNGVSRDHMYSVMEGYRNNIDPSIISHPANCKLLLQKNNASKFDGSSITFEELLDRIEKWNKKYNM